MEEVAFPRGNTELKDPGSKVLEEAKNNRPSKRKIPSKEAPTPKTDFLFGSASKKSESASSKPKSKRQKTGSAKQSLLPVGGGGVITVQKHGKKDEPLIESLSFNKLAKGTKLLGMVREVHDEFAVFSLPNFLTGYMLPEKGVSLLKCLSVGQCLAVTVVKIVTEHVKGGTSKRRIQVTAKPSALNSTDEPMSNIPLRGQILSVEDHGCLVDMGFGRKGFLSFDQVDGEYDILEEDVTPEPTDIRILQKGRIFDFMLAAPAKGTVYKLSLPSSQKLAKHTIIPLQNKTPSLASLAPGWLVTAKLDVLAKNGLCVTFFGNVFRAAVEMGHLGAIFKTDIREVSSEWKGIFSKNQSFPARIMAVDPATKLIRLSLQPHLLEISIPDDLPDVGTLIEGCTVVRQDPGIGALLALPDEFSREDDENANHPGLMAVEKYRLASNIKGVYVHISKAIDEKDSSLFAKEFAPSTTHSVRILSKLNWIDGVASGACSPSLIEAHVLTHADLKPGQVHKQVPIIAHLKDGGVLVNLGSGIRGLIPPMHLFETAASSEYRRKLMRVKFAVDSKVDVLVLWTDSKRKRCLLSAKKGLVKSDKVITSYSDMSVGTTATGFVSKVDDKALFVTFCDRVYGKITARSLVKDVGIEDHTANFHVGDIVTCRVVNIKKRRRNQKEDESDSEDDDVDIPSSKPFYEVNLALAVQGAEEKEVEFDEPELLHINTGGLLPSKSIKVLELVKGKEKKTGFVPGYAVVSVRSKYLLRENDSAKAPSSMECKLPYDQLEDDYDPECLKSAAALDKFAENMLSVGQKLEQKGFILSDPGKSNIEYSNAIGKFAVLSLRQKLVDQLEKQSKGKTKASGQMLPGIDTEFFVGSQVIGYVAQVDERHGAFVRFLDGLTGLVPKKQGALNLKPYSTVVSRVEIVDDSRSPPRILLKPLNGTKKIPTPEKSKDKPTSFQVGDVIEEATITNLGFHRAILHVPSKDANVTLHCSMKQCPVKSQAVSSKKNRSSAADGPMITSDHPFYKLKKGKTLKGLTVFSVGTGKDSNIVQVTDFTSDSEEYKAASQFESKHKVQPGTILSGVVTGVAKNAKGVYVALSPSISGFIPALELSEDVKLLNNMEETLVLGQRLKSCVIDQAKFYEARSKAPNQKHAKSSDDSESYMLSTVLAQRALDHAFSKPVTGDIVIGRLNSKVRQLLPPSMMVDLRGGYIGRCCITELEEPDEWENMPLGRPDQDEDDEEDDDREKTFAHGKFVKARVLMEVPEQPVLDVSLRPSRLEGDVDEDEAPEIGDTVNGYVIRTNEKGCFIRLARHIEARVMLKELSDGFIPDPKAAFPAGRLVVGRVKQVQDRQRVSKSSDPSKVQVDLDMRESVLLEDSETLKFEDIELNSKHKGTVTRIEEYGVFVRLQNSDVSGLVHKSECSDDYIKSLSKLYDPGDLVKVLVIKKDDEAKRIGFSMKASHFENDEDSDDDADSIGDSSSADESDDMEIDDDKLDSGRGLDSDDEDFVSKLADTVDDEDEKDDQDSSEGSSDSDASDSDSDSSSGEDSDEQMEDAPKATKRKVIDTDVGFEWEPSFGDSNKAHGDDDSSSSDSSDSESEDEQKRGSHKSKKNQAKRRREEEEIKKREVSLADGTADENPETAADFERLLAGNPNSSELWIRFMAFYLSLADVPSARAVADRAFARIEFHQEQEKLNVWTALLTLEHKYGSDESLKETIGRACQHNNPKQVYLRVCEILQKEVEANSSPEAVSLADNMFSKMCKKFKSKKTVWIAYFEYLLKLRRHEEAHALSKRAIMSLKEYKHAETMSKFAQLEFEFGSPERARTLFDGILAKNPKRLDIIFVFFDKEVKFGKVESARAMMEHLVNDQREDKKRFSDKQMKSIFKKWYRMEEEHGTADTCEHVKDMARSYVETTN